MSTQKWYMTHETYSRILDILACRGYGDEAAAAAAVRKEFGLLLYVQYEIVVESEDQRRKRSLEDLFGKDFFAPPQEGPPQQEQTR